MFVEAHEDPADFRHIKFKVISIIKVLVLLMLIILVATNHRKEERGASYDFYS